jgi:hypothetical protein
VTTLVQKETGSRILADQIILGAIRLGQNEIDNDRNLADAIRIERNFNKSPLLCLVPEADIESVRVSDGFSFHGFVDYAQGMIDGTYQSQSSLLLAKGSNRHAQMS